MSTNTNNTVNLITFTDIGDLVRLVSPQNEEPPRWCACPGGVEPCRWTDWRALPSRGERPVHCVRGDGSDAGPPRALFQILRVCAGRSGLRTDLSQ